MAWNSEEISELEACVDDSSFFKLKYIKLKLVKACNLRCPKCDYWQIKPDYGLATEELTDILDQGSLLGLETVHLSGGEPTLRHDLSEVVDAGRARGIDFRIITNGTHLSPDKQVDLAQRGVTGWTFSLDGADEQLHDEAMGVPGAYEKIVKSIEALVRQRDETGIPSEVGINGVLTRKNYDKTAELVYFGAGLGVDWIRLSPYDFRQSGINSTTKLARDDDLVLRKEDIDSFETEIRPELLQIVHKTDISLRPEGLPLFGNTSEQRRQAELGNMAMGFYRNHLCYMPWQHLTIFENGDAYVCCKKPDVPLGNVREQKIGDIVHDELMRSVRERFVSGEYFAACHSCTMKIYENKMLGELIGS